MTETLSERLTHTTRGRVIIVANLLALAVMVGLGIFIVTKNSFMALRRSGYIIVLLGSLLGLAIPVVHMRGAGVGTQIARAPGGGFFFVWTMIALGVTALFSVILSARGLWSPQWGQSR